MNLNLTIDTNDRDMFLQAVCDQMDEQGLVILPETLAEAQSVYDLAACQKFIDDNCNG